MWNRLSFYRWKLFRGSISFVCLTSSLYLTVCTVFAVAGFSRFVCTFSFSFFVPFVCLECTNNPAAPGEPLRKTDEIFSNLILSHFVLGVCWRWLCQGGDRGLGVGCYLSSTGRQTKWRWYLFLLVHQSPSYLRLCLHPGLKTPNVCLEIKITTGFPHVMEAWRLSYLQTQSVKMTEMLAQPL